MIEKVRVFYFQMRKAFRLQYGSDCVPLNLLLTMCYRKDAHICAHAIRQMIDQFPFVWIYPPFRVEVQRIFLQKKRFELCSNCSIQFWARGRWSENSIGTT